MTISGTGFLVGYPSMQLTGTITETGIATITLTDVGVNPVDPIVMSGQRYETPSSGKEMLFHGVSDIDPSGIPQDFELVAN